MLVRNQILELMCEDVGVCLYKRDDEQNSRGFVVFVPGALPRENVRVKILKVKKGYAYAKLLTVIFPSKNREEPPCSVFPACGGCDLLHMKYESALEYKQKIVYDCLLRITGQSVNMLPPIGADNPFRYRNKSIVPIGSSGGELISGFYAKRSHRIIAHDDCLISDQRFSEILRIIKQWMRKYSIQAYDEDSGLGQIRHVMCRNAYNGDIMVVLIVSGEYPDYARELTDMLSRRLPEIRSIIICRNDRRDNVLLDGEFTTIYGDGYIMDMLAGVQFRISPQSFFQINREQAQKLYQTAIGFLGAANNDVVVDAYCGAGAISCIISKNVKRVIGLEILPEAVEDARHNAEINDCGNVSFVLGAAEDILEDITARYAPTALIVDPPRKGCDIKLLNAILNSGIKRVVYISCDPATMARDLKILSSEYAINAVQIVDMFCNTENVETVALISRKK